MTYQKSSLLGWSLGVLAVAIFVFANQASAQILIEMDLSVTDEVTVTATMEPSAATVSGSDVTGFYLENFFPADGTALGETLITGDLTNFLNPTDNTPDLFRGGGTTDPGLNIWSFSSDTTVDFTSGTQAFTGSATWMLPSAVYADFLAANPTGDLYFPADTADDVADATLIGQYIILGGGPCTNDVGDVNGDGNIDLLDVSPFVAAITDSNYVCEADINQDGVVDLLDVAPFVALITGG